MQKITTFLMFNDKAGEAMAFYASVFSNSEIKSTMPGPNGSVMGGTIRIEDQEILTFNGGPHFSFSQGTSLMVRAESQQEVDHLYDSLSEGGEQQPCGWLQDKYGVSSQITPTILMKLLGDPDRQKAGRVQQAMMKMKKIDISELEKAANSD